MAAPAVAAVAKKVIVYILTDEKALKVVLGIVLGIIIIILLPLGVIIGVLNGDVEIDPDRMQEMIVQNLSAEEQAMLQGIEDTMYGIEDGMTNAGYGNQRVTEAQVLYVLALSSYSAEDGFVNKLVGCFEQEQTDEQLITAVNSAFGTNITAQDFSNVMSNIRNAYIDTSNYTDPNTKNSTDLVLWAEYAADKGWGYVYGTYGTVLSESMLTAKMEQYPDEVATKEQFIRDTWLGKRTADCVGLIKGYGWFNTVSQETVIGANNMQDWSANGMYDAATVKGEISTMPETPGLAVWKDGHIGIYIGDGNVIEAYNTERGVIRSVLSDGGWTHWLEVPNINYEEQEVTS